MNSRERRIQYITSVREVVERYCTFPCDKAPNRNKQALEIDDAFKKLAEWGEREEVANILCRLSEVWEDLRGNGVQYCTWLNMAVKALEPEGACWLFREHSGLFLYWMCDGGVSEWSVSSMIELMDANRWDEKAEKAQEIRDFKRFVSRNKKKAMEMREAADRRAEELWQEKVRQQEEIRAASHAAKERREARARERERKKEEGARREQTSETAVSVSDETQSALSFLKDNGIDLPKPFSKELRLLNTRINGSRYVDNIYQLSKELKEGDHVRLVLEPENPYDERAIRVDTAGGEKLGYVPRRANEILFNLMNAGKHVYGVVVDGDVGSALGKELSPEQIEIFIDVYMTD